MANNETALLVPHIPLCQIPKWIWNRSRTPDVCPIAAHTEVIHCGYLDRILEDWLVLHIRSYERATRSFTHLEEHVACLKRQRVESEESEGEGEGEEDPCNRKCTGTDQIHFLRCSWIPVNFLSFNLRLWCVAGRRLDLPQTRKQDRECPVRILCDGPGVHCKPQAGREPAAKGISTVSLTPSPPALCNPAIRAVFVLFSVSHPPE